MLTLFTCELAPSVMRAKRKRDAWSWENTAHSAVRIVNSWYQLYFLAQLVSKDCQCSSHRQGLESDKSSSSSVTLPVRLFRSLVFVVRARREQKPDMFVLCVCHIELCCVYRDKFVFVYVAQFNMKHHPLAPFYVLLNCVCVAILMLTARKLSIVLQLVVTQASWPIVILVLD